MTFSTPAYRSKCNRTYRFIDTMSSLCSRCSEARERLVELKRDEDRRREACAGAALSPRPPRPRTGVAQKGLADVRGPCRAPIAAPHKLHREAHPRGR
jgi:hypothetical protein